MGVEITLYYGDTNKELTLETQRVIIDYSSATLSVVQNNEKCTIRRNGKELVFLGNRNEYDVIPNEDGVSKFQFRINNSLINIDFVFSSVRAIEDKRKENLLHYIKVLRGCFNSPNNKILIKDLVSAFRNKNINFFTLKKPLTGFRSDDLIEKLKNDLTQKVRPICSHPKMGTRIEEVIQDVNIVKRINHLTLKNLASHTEHWKARTINKIIPNRLMSGIIEDEIDIYENLFFKVAIDDISRYVNRQIFYLNETYEQNRVIIDWEDYGNQLKDIYRNEIISNILGSKSVNDLQQDNKEYKKDIEKWMNISKLLSTIKSTPFYNQISKTKRIDRSIRMTSILKNDQRYKSLYDLYMAIKAEKQKEDILEGASNTLISNIYKTYQIFVLTCIIYAFEKLGVVFDENSYLSIDDDCNFDFSIEAQDSLFKYEIKKEDLKTNLKFKITIKEKLDIYRDVPSGCNLLVYKDRFFDIRKIAELSEDGLKICFHKKPDGMEDRLLRNILREDFKSFNYKENKTLYQQKKIWEDFLNSVASDKNIRNPKVFDFYIYPIFCEFVDNEEKVVSITEKMFLLHKKKFSQNKEEKINKDVFFCLPNHLTDFKNIKEEKAARRLINYGEAFLSSDDPSFGILPVDQADMFTLPRIIKLLSIRRAKLVMEIEKGKEKHCPICGNSNIEKIDANTFVCKKSSQYSKGIKTEACGITWGSTKCVSGCGEYFNWIKPGCDLEKISGGNEGILQDIALKENIFGRFIITDVQIVREASKIKTYPLCPKCGTKRDT